MFELGQQNGRLKQGEFNPNNAVMQFPVPGMPASGWQGLPASGWFFGQRDAGKVYQPLAGFLASETLADLSGETPEFRVLEFCPFGDLI